MVLECLKIQHMASLSSCPIPPPANTYFYWVAMIELALSLFSLPFFCLAGFDWGEVSPAVAFPWPSANMLCWASIFPDDCETHLYTWTWCYWTSRDWRMACNNFFFSWINLPTFFFISSFLAILLCILFFLARISFSRLHLSRHLLRLVF